MIKDFVFEIIVGNVLRKIGEFTFQKRIDKLIIFLATGFNKLDVRFLGTDFSKKKAKKYEK